MNRKIKHILFIFSFLFLVVFSSVLFYGKKDLALKEGDLPSFEKIIGKYIEKQMIKNDVDKISVCIADKNGMLWTKTFESYEIPIDSITKGPVKVSKNETPLFSFRLGSITKIFTGLGIMQLYEKGLVGLDVPIARYIPEFSIRSRFSDSQPITIRSLLTHHSGLPGNILAGCYPSEEPHDFSLLIDQLKSEYTVCPVNYNYGYSNIGYTLLGEIISRVSGLKYVEYMWENILKPLAMDHTGFYFDYRIKQMVPGSYYPVRDIPAGGLISNAKDMGRFMGMLLNRGNYNNIKILNETSVEQMVEKQNRGVILDRDMSYGLGFNLNYPDFESLGTVFGHSGDISPFHSDMIMLQSQGMGVLVMANSDSAKQSVKDISCEILHYGLQVYRGIPHIRKIQKKSKLNLNKMQIKELSGNYISVKYGLISVQKKWGKLRFYQKLINNPFKGCNGYFSFFSYKGQNYIQIDSKGEKSLVALQFDPVPINEKWKSYFGDYKNYDKNNNQNYYRVVSLYEFQGYLIFDAGMFYFLKPINDQEALVMGIGRDTMQTVRISEENGALYLHYLGQKLKRMK